MDQWPNLSLIYILNVFYILLLLLLFIVMFHPFYVFISRFIRRFDFNNSPVVVVCCFCCCFFSFCAASDLYNHIVLYSTASTYDNFNMGFGTVIVGGKFENHLRRLCGPQFYKYPLELRTCGNNSGNYVKFTRIRNGGA